MEGYDLGLVGNLIGLRVFREKFGKYFSEAQGYQVTAAWQSAVTQAPNVGAFLGAFLAASLASRIGYRWTLVLFMIWMIAAIFFVFFANFLGLLFAGQFLSGIPRGAFVSIFSTALTNHPRQSCRRPTPARWLLSGSGSS